MPHKHKRKRDEDTSNFDLAPSTRAKPLAAYTKATIFSKGDEENSNKRRKSNVVKPKKTQDGTPKAFARLMAWQSTGKRSSGLDDGTSKSNKKKRKQSQKTTDTTTAPQPNQPTPNSTSTTTTTTTTPPTSQTQPTPPTTTTTTHPKILPTESLSTFSLRVDQTLPLTNIQKHTNPNLPADLQAALKKSQRTTKHNKRLQKMQADWRLTETKLREQEADEADEAQDRREEEDLLWSSVRSASNAKKGKKKRSGNNNNNKDDKDDDPWRDLEKKRREETRQRGLQDVVKAPPVLKKVKSKFKAREEDFEALDGKTRDDGEDVLVVDVGNVPGKVGSLRRREELNATRKAVIEGYRRMQRGKKRGVGERLNMAMTVMT